jgi:flagellar basal-body rod protein FlgF
MIYKIAILTMCVIAGTFPHSFAADNAGYSLINRQESLRRALTVVANNIANMDTVGYQEDQLVFQEYSVPDGSGGEMTFSQDIATIRTQGKGNLRFTGNKFDMALQGGEGYFVVETPGGLRYTRAGNFQLDVDGNLVTAQGHLVTSNGGTHINIPLTSTNVSINNDGSIVDDGTVIGKIGVATFSDPRMLRKEGGDLLMSITPPVMNPPDILVKQGFLEESNVNSVQQLTKMMEIQRDVGSGSDLLKSISDITRGTIQVMTKNGG